ncbi:hypothetical protein K469DRAFT_303243 [Zopfia rhizophila CBS 207.26]|uniref:Uncharacterized protein n=1 Tax=Zopfia rhizophila CBS 207.26 TaxID=1314779 RepID=A0A6A6DIV5_9PEZI|nr:hypothetical protein K469DRAFT_303243 [Zopfia rhizophila CBS 207.26]
MCKFTRLSFSCGHATLLTTPANTLLCPTAFNFWLRQGIDSCPSSCFPLPEDVDNLDMIAVYNITLRVCNACVTNQWYTSLDFYALDGLADKVVTLADLAESAAELFGTSPDIYMKVCYITHYWLRVYLSAEGMLKFENLFLRELSDVQAWVRYLWFCMRQGAPRETFDLGMQFALNKANWVEQKLELFVNIMEALGEDVFDLDKVFWIGENLMEMMEGRTMLETVPMCESGSQGENLNQSIGPDYSGSEVDDEGDDMSESSYASEEWTGTAIVTRCTESAPPALYRRVSYNSLSEARDMAWDELPLATSANCFHVPGSAPVISTTVEKPFSLSSDFESQDEDDWFSTQPHVTAPFSSRGYAGWYPPGAPSPSALPLPPQRMLHKLAAHRSSNETTGQDESVPASPTSIYSFSLTSLEQNDGILIPRPCLQMRLTQLPRASSGRIERTRRLLNSTPPPSSPALPKASVQLGKRTIDEFEEDFYVGVDEAELEECRCRGWTAFRKRRAMAQGDEA